MEGCVFGGGDGRGGGMRMCKQEACGAGEAGWGGRARERMEVGTCMDLDGRCG